MIKHCADPDWTNGYGTLNDFEVPASEPTTNW